MTHLLYFRMYNNATTNEFNNFILVEFGFMFESTFVKAKVGFKMDRPKSSPTVRSHFSQTKLW